MYISGNSTNKQNMSMNENPYVKKKYLIEAASTFVSEVPSMAVKKKKYNQKLKSNNACGKIPSKGISVSDRYQLIDKKQMKIQGSVHEV